MKNVNDSDYTQSLGVKAARKLATTTKSAPMMESITPRWLCMLLPWVTVVSGTYRVNKRKMSRTIDMISGHVGEPAIPETFVDYSEEPREYQLDVVQSILKIHTRVSELYSSPTDQLREQLRLTTLEMKERKEWEVINNPKFGLLNSVAPSQKIQTRNGPPTPDDLDELLTKLWKRPALFLAHPMAIAAFGRECTRRGVPPPTMMIHGSPFLTWRGRTADTQRHA